MKFRALAVLAISALVVLSTGCSSDSSDGADTSGATTTEAPESTDPPETEATDTDLPDGVTADSIAGAITAAFGTTEDTADCAAPKVIDADLSDEALQAIAAGDRDSIPASETESVEAALQEAIGSCS